MLAEKKIYQLNSRILSHEKVSSGYFLLDLEAPDIAGAALPGQFIHLRVDKRNFPLLRRPFSFHRIKEESIEILYQVKGEGTGLLSERKAGEKLDLIGPLGNGFNLENASGNKEANG